MHEDAIELLTTALIHSPNDQLITYERAQARMKLEDYTNALPDAQTVYTMRPGWVSGVIMLGHVEAKLGDWRSAARHWHEALLLQPHNPNLRRDLERATVEMSDEEAKECA